MKTSLTFVIDVTGSMSNDIKEAKRATKKIVIEAKDSQFVPENYVLVTFSDPGVLLFSQSPKECGPSTVLGIS